MTKLDCFYLSFHLFSICLFQYFILSSSISLFQAYGGSLFGMAPLDGGFEWSDDSKRGLDDLIMDKDLFAVVKSVTVDESRNPPINLTVELIDTSVEPNVVVTRELVRRGLARKRIEVNTAGLR